MAMVLISEQKELILKTVHCTKYLKSIHEEEDLVSYERNGLKCYRKGFFLNLEWNSDGGREACLFNREWESIVVLCDKGMIPIHVRKFELKDNEFEGVVEKIEEVFLSGESSLYADNKQINMSVPAEGCSTMAATVCLANGCKRIVPLDCIREYAGFTVGMKSGDVGNNLKLLSESKPIPNVITVADDGSIAIENTYQCMNRETGAISLLHSSLFLDMQKKLVKVVFDDKDGWFDILDNEYQKIMNILEKQLEKEYGFIPYVSYGETNFDRLVNFVNYPFAPELNGFSKLFEHENVDTVFKDYAGIEYCCSQSIKDDLKNSPDGIRKFINYCGLDYTSKIKKRFMQGCTEFAKFLGIWYAGFRDNKVIEHLTKVDWKGEFAALIFDNVIIGNCCKINSGDLNIQTGFCFCTNQICIVV